MTIARLSLGFGFLLALFIGLTPYVSSAAQVNITMGSNYFSPNNITINVGDTVIWKNTDSMQHSATANNYGFNSGTMQPGAVFSYTFNTPGTYSYFCMFHSGMTGTITVSPAAQTVVPPASSSVTELQTQIQALLARVQQLQAQYGGTTVIPGGTVPIVPVVNTNTCPLIGRPLGLGASGDDVTRLQQFLARDPSIYPERLVTGYYGSLTEAAVRRWQVKFNIVSSGNPSTTGYGVVGPRTAASMSLQCANGTYGSGGGSGGGETAVGGFIRVTPIAGSAPLSVSIEATVNTVNSCTGGLYTVEYGDGTAPSYISVPGGNCQPMIRTLQHTYVSPGTYQITLSAGAHRTSATVVVSGTTPPTSSSDSISANPTSGEAPVTITFTGIINGARSCNGGTYTIDFGDGQTTQILYPADGCTAVSFNSTHQYTTGGTFTAKLYPSSQASGTVAANATVTVSGGQALGPFVVTPGIDGNPLKLEVKFDIASSCSAYDLDWGDSSAHVTQAQGSGCSQAVTQKTFTHTYAAGTYTIKLIRGSTTDTASVVVSN